MAYSIFKQVKKPAYFKEKLTVSVGKIKMLNNTTIKLATTLRFGKTFYKTISLSSAGHQWL
jgi:hypothetical protein